jgi:hypothetical protein
VIAVIEAKAGRSAARGLATGSSEIGDVEEFARFMIEEQRARVLSTLRRAGLDDDVRAVEAGSVQLSDDAAAAIRADPALRRSVIQAELGGQVRRDIERLAPHENEDMARILVDGEETAVRFSPTRTRFVGALPDDVNGPAVVQRLHDLGITNVETLAGGVSQARVTNAARQLLDTASP